MIVLNFDPRASLICLRLTLEATYRRTAVLIFDPGASLTLLTFQTGTLTFERIV